MRKLILLLMFYSLSLAVSAGDEPASPPGLGQETKGEPAIPEKELTHKLEKSKSANSSLSALGTTRVTESKRENGQVYRIQLEHSMGGKQYIEEHDSDGKIESTNNDIEETPNLPKWKLGSW